MPSQDWQEIYRSYTGDELAAEKARLKKILEDRQGLTAQGLGAKNWQSDNAALERQLHSVARVLFEKANAGKATSGVMDYSNVQV